MGVLWDDNEQQQNEEIKMGKTIWWNVFHAAVTLKTVPNFSSSLSSLTEQLHDFKHTTFNFSGSIL